MSEGGPTPEVESVFDDDDDGSTSGAIRIAWLPRSAACSSAMRRPSSAVRPRRHRAGLHRQLRRSVSLALGIDRAARCTHGWRIADRIGRLKVMRLPGAVLHQCHRLCLRAGALGRRRFGRIYPLPNHWWFRRRRRLVIAPAYIAETAPARIRGRLGSFAATGDRPRHIPLFLVNCTVQRAGGRGQQSTVVGPGRVAVDVPHDGHSRDRLRCSPAPFRNRRYLISKLAASRRPAQSSRSSLGEKNLEITINRIRSSMLGSTNAVVARPQSVRPAASIRSSGSACCCRCCSRPWASTSSSLPNVMLWGGRRLRREPGVLDVDDHLGDQHRDDDRRDPADRPRRSRRCCWSVDRHGGDALSVVAACFSQADQ